MVFSYYDSVFVSLRWRSVLEKSYKFPIVYDISCVPIYMSQSFFGRKKWVAVPFGDYAVLPEVVPDEGLLREIAGLAVKKGISSIEWRGGNINLPEWQKCESFVLHQLKLQEDINAVFKSFHIKTVRWGINKSKRLDVKTKLSYERKDFDIFVRLNRETRRQHGLPPQPTVFMDALYDTFIASKSGFVSISEWRNQPVAASVFLLHGKTMYYKYNASCDLAQKCQANNAALWEAIQWGCENGYEIMDFGRSEVEHASLRRFKRNWGTEETVLPYYYWGEDSHNIGRTDGRTMNMAKKLFSRMPLGLLQVIGDKIYKYAA